MWGTYFGGEWEEETAYVACDKVGNIYLAGFTMSDSMIASSSTVFRPTSTWADGYDCYLAKFSSSGTRQWSTYFGGSGYDRVTDVECDTSGNVYLLGYSTTNSGLASSGAWSISGTGFLAKFTGSGSRVWATYLETGSSSVICPNGLSIHKGNFYIAGYTNSAGLATSGLDTVNDGWDGYLTMFDSTGSRVWATYIGGNDTSSNYEELNDVYTSPAGTIYGIGVSGSSDIATTGAWKNAPANSTDESIMFVAFDSIGKRTWTTLWGGASIEDLHMVPFSGAWGASDVLSPGPEGLLFFCGGTESTSGVATTGAHQTTATATYAGGGAVDDAVLGCVAIDTAVYLVLSDTVLCAGQTVNIGYGTSLSFNSSNTFTAQLSNSSGSFSSPTTIGSASGTTGGSIQWAIPSTLTLGTYKLRILASSPSRSSVEISVNVYSPVLVTAGLDTAVCVGDTIQLNASSSSAGTISYTWTGPSSFAASSKNVKRQSATTAMSGNYIVTATRGCIVRDTVSVSINAVPATPDGSYNEPLCLGDTLRLYSTQITGANYSWRGPNSYTAAVRTPEKLLTQFSDSGLYIVNAILNGCTSIPDTIKVKINTVSLDVSVSPNDTICEADAINFTATALPAFATRTYQWYKGATAITGATSGTYSGGLVPTDSIIYCNTTFSNVCAGTVSFKDTVKMHVKPLPNINATSNSPLCAGDTMKLYVLSTSAGSITYSWAGPDSFISSFQNPIRPLIDTAMSGNYIVTATILGCNSKDTVAVTVHPTPATPVATSDTLICITDTMHLRASTIAGATYSWTGPNGFSSQAEDTFKTNLQMSDSGRYIVTAIKDECTSIPDTAWIGVLPQLNLAVNILATPGTGLRPSDTVTLEAVLPNGGILMTYQWYKNGVLTHTDTNGTWTTTGLSQGDTVILVATTAYPCVDTNTASDTIVFHFPAFATNVAGKGGLRLYPNPNKGSFVVQGITAGTADVEIINAIGQVVHKDKVSSDSGTINISAKLRVGHYLLKLRQEGSTDVLKFVVLE